MQGSGRPVVTANAWRGGRLVAQGLRITEGSLKVTAGQNVRSDLSLTVIDPTGNLRPTADGPLSPYGSEIELRGGTVQGSRRDTVPLGWFRISSAEPTEGYRVYESEIEAAPRYVSTGVTVALSAKDRAEKVRLDLLVNGEQPSKSTVLAEIARLLQGVVPWVAPAFADRPLAPTAVTYDSDRLQACMDLAALLNCDLVFTPAGAATLIRQVPPLVSVWDLPRGSSSVIGSVKTAMSSDDVHNAVFARATVTDFAGNVSPLVGKAYDRTAGIAWGGPYGRVPLVIDVELATTQADVNKAAADELAKEQRSRWLARTVECVCNYALEVGDVVSIPCPKRRVLGQVTSADWPLTQGLMSITVSVDPFVWEAAQ